MALRGMTLIEALIGCFLMLVVFLGIFGVFQVSIDLVFSTKAATGANALVNERMEYIRALDYNSIGTVGGIPSGAIPQSETRMLNGIPYTLTTLIQYADDPADGSDADDETGITADYKLIRVGAEWQIRGKERSTFAVTRISPHGIESLSSGGTLRVNVFDILAAPVSGAEVHIVNTNLDPAIDLSITTGQSGSVVFPGAPPGAGYEVSVTKSDHSSAQTYDVTIENPNPNPGHVSVVNQTTTTISLEINELGSLLISTFSPVGPGSFTDTFDDDSLLSAVTDAQVLGGSIVLTGEPGSYPSAGAATSVSITPQHLSGWESLSWTQTAPENTSALVRIYYFDGVAYAPIPDTDLPGNSVGFSGGFADLTTVAPGTYGTLRIAAELVSADPMVTPEISDWQVAYRAGPTPLPDVDFDIRGARTVGISGGGAPIYKYDESHTTTQYGTWLIDPIEADAYVVTLPGSSAYTIFEMCPSPLSIGPGDADEVVLTLVDSVAHSLRVVVSGSGAPIAGANVSITGGGVDEEAETSVCGQTFFDVPSDTYTVTVSAPGYQTSVNSNILVSGASLLSISLAL